jgi:hypothetical protein
LAEFLLSDRRQWPVLLLGVAGFQSQPDKHKLGFGLVLGTGRSARIFLRESKNAHTLSGHLIGVRQDVSSIVLR